MNLIREKTMICLALIGLAITTTLSATPVTQLPYECTFEDPAEWAQWITKKRTTTSTEFVTGFAASYMGEKSMYISTTSGMSVGYNDPIGSGYYIVAYREFALPAGTYDLAFMWKSLGMAGQDAAAVAWVPSNLIPNLPAGLLGTFPNYITSRQLALTNSPGNLLQESASWQQSKGKLVVSTNDENYSLVFCWKANGDGRVLNPGVCIDNLQIGPATLPSDCHTMPTNLNSVNTTEGTTFSWVGNASEYELEYFVSGSTTHVTISNITNTSYTVPIEHLTTEGIYFFRVRAICGSETGLWAESKPILVYDVTAHCLDFLNFNAPGVICTYGDYQSELDPAVYDNRGFIDQGFASIDSRHTIHYIPGETDPRTNGGLKTVPAGGLASVRLGNWDGGGYGQTVTYTVNVDSTIGVLQLKYAIVAQSGGHGGIEQPIFYLRILDSIGNTINGNCGIADFRPPTSGVADGWHIGNMSNIYWRNWTSVGINLQDYIGQRVRVQLISAGCIYTEHWGYAYFTLDCSDGKMKGLACGVKPDRFEVDEGFNYRWYQKFDPAQTTLSTRNVFELASASDTITYCCDLIQPNNASCYFTLEASALGRLPKAYANLKHAPRNCINYVNIENNSGVFGFYYVEDEYGVAQYQEVRLAGESVSYSWTIETADSIWISTEATPSIIVSNEGGWAKAELVVRMDNTDCTDTLRLELDIPAISEAYATTSKYVCYGENFEFNGKIYSEAGVYTDSLKTWTGCDSVLTFTLNVLKTDTIILYDTICSYETPYIWFNDMELDTTGIYTYSIPSSLGSCDSMYYELHLKIHEALDMAINYEPQIMCSGNMTIYVPYEVYAGDATTYDLLFDEASHRVGFTDILDQPVLVTDNIELTLTDDVWAGDYTAKLLFKNSTCSNMEFTIQFTIYYNADSVITQRWNDLLSVRKTAYEHYGGFTEYQWYKNNLPILGETNTQLYEPESNLDTTAEYSVELVRAIDGVRMRSCAFTPIHIANDAILLVSPTRINAQKKVNVRTSVAGKTRMYNIFGERVSYTKLNEGDNFISTPATIGMYILEIELENGKRECRKIIVE